MPTVLSSPVTVPQGTTAITLTAAAAPTGPVSLAVLGSFDGGQTFRTLCSGSWDQTCMDQSGNPCAPGFTYYGGGTVPSQVKSSQTGGSGSPSFSFS